MVSFGPCTPWDPIWCTTCDLPTGSQAVTGDAVAAATEILWAASGQRYGPCPVTLRPCRRTCAGDWGSRWPQWTGRWPQPALIGGAWYNLVCGSCGDTCSCTALEETVLPAPVSAVTAVKVDGQLLPSSAYRLHNGRVLVRVDGGRWPWCQNMAADDSATGTWSVTVSLGEDVPIIGRQAVGELACEITRTCMGVDCRLPANIASLVRQGVSIQFPASQELVDRLYFVGMFLRMANPHKLAGRPAVYDVDGPRWRTTT